MIRSYPEAIKRLSSYIRPSLTRGGSYGVERTAYLLRLMGDPQATYPMIHVGGTSGKGSTSTMIAHILRTVYTRVGLHTSPNLVTINERMNINGVPISDEDMVILANETIPLLSRIPASYGMPTYFEILTAMTLLYFAKKTVDVAVIEVGLGGIYDATNVVKPEVAVITNVGLDHTEILGDTVEQIASDKSGIIKDIISVVSGVTQPSVVEIILTECEKHRAFLRLLHRDILVKDVRVSLSETVCNIFSRAAYPDLHISLVGRYQADNAALAISAVEEFQKRRKMPLVSSECVKNALSSISLPGRFEYLSKQPLIILDGAHNTDKVSALAQSLQELFPKKRIYVVFSAKQGKHLASMVHEIARISSDICVTSFSHGAESGEMRSFSLEDMISSFQDVGEHLRVCRVSDPLQAIEQTKQKMKRDDIMVVTGSLYLVGYIKAHQS